MDAIDREKNQTLADTLAARSQSEIELILGSSFAKSLPTSRAT
jgi:hypothetical protein